MKQILLISKFPLKDGTFEYQNLLLTIGEDFCSCNKLKANLAYELIDYASRKEIIDNITTLYEI